MSNITLSRFAGAIVLRSIQRFVAEHLADISEESLLLGGPAAQRRFLRLVSRLRHASGLGPHLRRDIRWLHGLLTLEQVGDPNATNPGHFCDIHPDDLVVTGICRLADAMTGVFVRTPDHVGAYGHFGDREACPSRRGLISPVGPMGWLLKVPRGAVPENDFWRDWMNDTQLYAMPIEELAARTLVSGRALADDLPVNLLAADAHQHSRIHGLLHNITDDDPAGPRSRQSVDLLADNLGAERETETLGYEDVFEGENDPEYGATGAVYRHRVLSDRGEAIEVWSTKILYLARMMRILDARISGERIINRRISI